MKENAESLAAVERERERERERESILSKDKKSLVRFLHPKFNMVKIAK